MTKPRLKLTPVNEICVFDTVLFAGQLRTIVRMRRGKRLTYVHFNDSASNDALLDNGKKYYAETALQTYARSPRGRELSGATARAKQVPPYPPRNECAPELDDGQRSAVAQAREGCAAPEPADPVQGVQQPRASVCMTLGRDIKPGQQLCFEVSPDGTYSMGGVRFIVNPFQYYMVVNKDKSDS